jgi:hypothetical protein
MNKGIMIKVGIILGAFILIIGLAVGCTAIKNNEKTPVLENGDNVYVSLNGVDVTNNELYKEMLLSGGASYLVQYAEEHLLADYISKVTDEELLAEKEYLIYRTKDELLIAEYQADTELNDAYVQNFEDQMILLGYNPDDMDDLRSYLSLNIAKQKYLEDYINGLEEGDPLYVSDEDVEEYYNDLTLGTAQVLTIRFSSTKEAEKVLEEFNIVVNYDGINWGLYDPSLNGDKPLAEADEDNEINSTNTTVLNPEEVFSKFILIWNYMYEDNAIAEDISQETLMNDYSDITTLDYEDYLRNEYSNAAANTYAKYVFNTLEIPEEGNTEEISQYSFQIQTAGEFAFISYKMDQTEKTPYLDLTQAQRDEYTEEYMRTLQTSANLDAAMEELWLANELVVYDPIIKLQYKYQEGKEFDNNGSETLVATLGDLEITPKDLFEYMSRDYGLYTAMEIAQSKALLQSDLFTEVYGEDRDYKNSDNEVMQGHIEDLKGFQQYFTSNAFSQANLSSDDYTWEEFIQLYLQCEDEYAVLEKISISGNLQNYLINETINYEDAIDFIQEQADNYFSLNTEHILLYVDNDFNFKGDDYSDFLDGLSGQALTDYETLLNDFQALVVTKVRDEGMSLEDVVNEYEEAYYGDTDNVWLPFKKAGFFIMTQDLSSSASNTYLNTYESFDEAFVENLKRIYDAYVLEVNNSAEVPDHYADTKVFESDFGIHYIYATEGDGFEQPTAVFDNADGDYDARNVGTTIAPNKDQIELYLEVMFDTTVGIDNTATIAPSVQDAIDAYYTYLYSFYWPSQNNSSMPVTIMTINYALDNNITFASDQDEHISDLELIVERLTEMNFPDGFLPEED